MTSHRINGDKDTHDRNSHRSGNGRDRGFSQIAQDIRKMEFGDHDIIVYHDLPSFRKIYSECVKLALDGNEIVFLATTYDPFSRVFDSLAARGISVNNETKNGNLIILDSIKAYQIDVEGAYKFAKSIAGRATLDGKAGIFNISDMGSFFLAERIATLLQYEQRVPKKWISRSRLYARTTRTTLKACPRFSGISSSRLIAGWFEHQIDLPRRIFLAWQ